MAKYMILGAGKQGLALAYYLSKYYNPEKIYLVDYTRDRAEQARQIVEHLTGNHNIETRGQVFGKESLFGHLTENANLLMRSDVVVSALPHEYNEAATRLAVLFGANYCDFGFDAGIVNRQLADVGVTAKNIGVSVVPNCGVGPGLVNILAVGGAKETQADSVRIYIGGNPQKPDNAWRYKRLFSGVVHEYTGTVEVLEDGKLVTKKVPCEQEDIFVNGSLGALEAFLAQTSFGLTAKILQELGVKNAFEKTVRFPGHYTVVKALQELGFLSQDSFRVNDTAVIPLDFTTELINQNLPDAADDFLFLKIFFEKSGKGMLQAEMMLYNDTNTGFSAMQRSTASVVAIVANMLAEKKLPAGAYLPEQEIDYKDVLNELWRMGFPITLT